MIKALILAGGKGTRLRPLTLNTPKPIVPIANIPFLFYQLDLVKRAGITEIILSLSYQPRKIKDIFGDGSKYGVTIRYTVEEIPLGTAGAFKVAENLIDDTTVVFNGDILTNVNLQNIIEGHKQRSAAATIVLKRVQNPSAYGLVETTSDGRVKRFIEKPKDDEITCDMINAGIYVLEPNLLRYIPPNEEYSFERGFFPRILDENENFFAVTLDGYWLDIGTHAKYLEAHYDIMSGRIEIPKFLGLFNRHQSKRVSGVFIDELSLVHEECIIKPEAVIEYSVIGKNCLIGEGATIRNSVIWPGTRIERHAFLDSCIIGKNCYIGELAKVNHGKILGDKSVIADYSQL